MQINSVSNIKKMNSNNRQGLINILGEYERTNEDFKNNVNLNLSSLNVILEENNMEQVLGDVTVAKNAKDVILLTCGVEMSEYEKITETPGEYLLSLDEWKDYFKIKLNEYKAFMGDDFKIIKAIIHFDEMRPHMQVMGAYRSEKNDDIDMVKLERAMSVQFSRLNKKGKEWETIDTKNDKKKYQEKYKQWYEENIEKYKAKEIVKSVKKNIEYSYKASSNKFNERTSFKDFFDYNYNNDSKNKIIEKLLNEMRKVTKEVDFVRRKTISRSASAKNIEDMKKTIAYEKEFLKMKIDNNTATLEEKSKYKEMKMFENMIQEKLKYTLDEYLDNRKNKKHEILNVEDNKSSLEKFNNEIKNNIYQKMSKLNEIKRNIIEQEIILNEKQKRNKEIEDNTNKLKQIKDEIDNKNKHLNLINDINELNNTKKQLETTNNNLKENNKKINDEIKILNDNKLNLQNEMKKINEDVEKAKEETQKNIEIYAFTETLYTIIDYTYDLEDEYNINLTNERNIMDKITNEMKLKLEEEKNRKNLFNIFKEAHNKINKVYNNIKNKIMGVFR